MIKLYWGEICFDYHGDELSWVWPGFRTSDKCAFYSKNLDKGFRNLREYWMYVGGLGVNLRTHKLKGFFIEDIAKETAIRESQFGPVILIERLDPESKPHQFWSKLGKDKSAELNSDFCLLFPETVSNGYDILRDMPMDFADATLFDRGIRLDDNLPGVRK